MTDQSAKRGRVNRAKGTPIWVADTDGTNEYVSEGVESQSGYTSKGAVSNSPHILQGVQHAVEPTNGVQNLSEIVPGDGTLDLKPGPLRQILSEELEKRREAFSDAETTKLEPPDPRTHVLANALLSSMFRNLVNNTVRDTHTAQRRVIITGEEGDESVRVRTVDSGSEIPDERKQSLFGEGKKGLKGWGTGMGLFLLESYGGDVWTEDRARSEPFGGPEEGGQIDVASVVELPAILKRNKSEGN